MPHLGKITPIFAFSSGGDGSCSIRVAIAMMLYAWLLLILWVIIFFTRVYRTFVAVGGDAYLTVFQISLLI